LEDAERRAESRREQIKRIDATIEQLKLQLADTETARRTHVDSLLSEDETVRERKAYEDALPDLLPQATEIKQKIANAETTNRLAAEAANAATALGDAEDKLQGARETASDCDYRHIKLCQARTAALQGARFPVEGLSIGEDGTVLLKGIPFQQASTAQKIRLGVALAAAANPTLRVAFVRDGSLLDAASMAVLSEMAKKHNLQVFVERVQNEPGSIQIVDGHGGNQPIKETK
jgi:hypothetical protein